ncbi:coenzyme F420-0:L-glutamate ligase [Gammaproteobacteria bacterium]|nr:coenzyme F420-0:L-glutamate ligase [Gammaproteobacteria bacterium]
MNSINLIALKDFPLIQPGDDLAELIISQLTHQNISLEDGDILTIAQKVVSKSENRYLDISTLIPTKEAISLSNKIDKDPQFVQAILNESKQVVRHRMGVLIVEHKLGFIHANAGIDRSNIDQSLNQVLLLPKNPDLSAKKLCSTISNHFSKKIALIITDTMGRPFRNGIVGFSIGSSNIESVVDERGKQDIYGNILKVTQIAVADELAGAASLLMGQADQKKPIVLIRGYKFNVSTSSNGKDLIRSEEEDLFR